MKMKAIGFMEHGGPEVLKVIEIDKPTPGKHQVLLKVQGTSVNYADILLRKGMFHTSGTVFPVVPGLDAMGIVEEVGSEVTNLKKGQRVIAFPHTGTYAEYVLADGNLAFAIPDEMSFEQAVASPLVSFTAHMLLNKVSKLEKGETLVFQGAAGGLGTTTIQMAKNMGATVIATVRNAEQVSEMLKIGADYAINNETENFVEKVNEITNGKGADVIFDPLGGKYTSDGMGCLAPYGRMIIINNSSGSYSQIDTGLLHGTCRSVLGYSIATTRRLRPEWFADTAEDVIKLMTSGKVDMKISTVLNLENAAKAHEMLVSQKIIGKIILKV